MFVPGGTFGFPVAYYVKAICIPFPPRSTIFLGMPRKLELLKRSYPHDNGWIDIQCALDGKLADLQVHLSNLEGWDEARFLGFCERAADSLISTFGDYRHQRDRCSSLPPVESHGEEANYGT